MRAIYAVKGGRYRDGAIAATIKRLSSALRERGAQKVILGCTELSLYAGQIADGSIIDPMAVLAAEAVLLSRRT
jgi:aspartate/glutamate racemase